VAEPALALIEFSSIAAGTRAVDALVKKAPIELNRVGTLQPGRFAVMFSGDVASVDESFGEALRVGGTTVSDRVMLPHIDPSVYRAALGALASWQGDTLGIIEIGSLAPTIEAADVAVKGANVAVVSIRLGDELGGKGVAHFVGEQHDVEAAIALGTARVQDGQREVHSSITPRYDDELRGKLNAGPCCWCSRSTSDGGQTGRSSCAPTRPAWPAAASSSTTRAVARRRWRSSRGSCRSTTPSSASSTS
jgi:microcompartment protein CcmL/EutN